MKFKSLALFLGLLLTTPAYAQLVGGTNSGGGGPFLPTSGGTITGTTTVSGASFGLTGNQSASGIFGTTGIRYANVAGTLNDTTATGTITNNYDSVFGGNTLTSTSAVTITNDYGSYFKVPVCSTNVTCTANFALGADSAKIGGATISSGGQIAAVTNVIVGGTSQLSFSARANIASPADSELLFGNNAGTNTFILSQVGATATPDMQLGALDVAGSPVAQTLSVQSAASVSNTAGADATIDLSAGTGTGISGNLIINGAPHSTTGSTKNSYSPVLTINGDTGISTFNGTTTNGTYIAIANSATNESELGSWLALIGSGNATDTVVSARNKLGLATNNGTVYMTISTAGAVNMTGLAQSTAADVMCYAVSTGLLTYEPTGTTCTVSARRFKQDINYLSDSRMLDEVLGMKPVSYRYKPGIDDGGAETHYGLIAEDVQKAAPELVTYEKDGQTHGVKYGDGELQSHLVGAIKAEQAEINQLKKQSASLSSEFCLGSLCVGWK